jgi:7,8-dihydroneopterin aldolase/epimerase/oxygenase
MYRIDAACLDEVSTTCAAAPARDATSPEVEAPGVYALPARMDIVFIENFVGQTVIGIDRGEQDVTQPVRMNLAIGVASLRACSTDRIEDTINYAAVRSALHALLAAHGVCLLEALAEAVARLVIVEFGAHWVRVSLAKPAKFDDVTAVGVQIERRRSDMLKPVAALTSYASLGKGLFPN